MAVDYVAYNKAGARVVGVANVDTVEEAEKQLWSSGLLLVEVNLREEKDEGSLAARLLPSLFSARLRDVVTATRQLETLLRAGVALPTALRQLREQTRNPGFRDVLRAVSKDIESGERFSRACAKHPDVFPSYYLRLLPMAEETGDLPTILNGLLTTMQRQLSVGSQAKKAVVTPAISLVVASFAGVVLFTFVLPRLVDLLGEFGGQLPLATRMLMNTAAFGQAYGIYVLLSLMLGVGSLSLFLTRSDLGMTIKDQSLMKIPVISGVVVSSAMFDVCSTMTLLLRAGVNPVAALRAITSMTGNRVLRTALATVESQVTQGARLGDAAKRQPDLPNLFSDTLANGDQSGALRQNLEALADYYQGETERAVAQSTTMLEPMLILLVGAFVGFIAIGIISGIYSVIPQIGSSI